MSLVYIVLFYLQVTHQCRLSNALHAVESHEERRITTCLVFLDLTEDEWYHYGRLVIGEGGHFANTASFKWRVADRVP